VVKQGQNSLHMAEMSAEGQVSRYLSNKAVQALLPQHVLLFHDTYCLSCLVEGPQIRTGHATCLQQPHTQHIGSPCIQLHRLLATAMQAASGRFETEIETADRLLLTIFVTKQSFASLYTQ